MPSSVIKHMRYSEETQHLHITFQSGARYRYSQVPPAVYFGLLSARSKGRYFNQQIAGIYPFKRLSD